MQRLRYVWPLAILVALGVGVPLAAAAPTFYTDRATFLADPRVSSTTSIDFDGSAPGTDLTGQTISGVTLTAPGSSPLLVITGAAGVRFVMSPSSGANVLSPGGSNAALENDDLTLTFASAVRAVGLDVVFDAPDGLSFTGVDFRDAANASLGGSGFIPAPNGAPGFQFVGLVADSAIIKSVLLDEFDGSADDDNVAYDSIIFSPAFNQPPPPCGQPGGPACPVPEPSTLLLLGTGVATLGSLLRRGRK